MTCGFFVLPLVYVFTPFLGFADYPLGRVSFAAGLVLLAATFWLFHRAHADLGANWSVSLELREGHQLVCRGVYRCIRHPMYAAIFLYGVAQTLLLPNWMAGPACLASFSLMFAGRVRAEERMMRDRFGEAYVEYAAATKRLIPKVW
jgi:protein-S-isoprenylcysteine O-methyltransferase Ste14